jgi:mRNA interferase MazF
MRRGDIRLVDLDPVIVAEANKTRPCVVVTNDGSNRVAIELDWGVVTVVPITTNLDRFYEFQVLLPARECGLRADSKAQCEQVRAVAVQRVGDLVGRVPRRLMNELDEALRVHLDLGFQG